MPTFEDDRSGESRNRRAWGDDHRTPPRRHHGGRTAPREPYLRLDSRRLFRRDLEEMDDDELERIASRLESDNKSITEDLPALSGDAEIKAKDKRRFNEQWIRTIREELLEYEPDDEEIDDLEAFVGEDDGDDPIEPGAGYLDAEELERMADQCPTPVADRVEEYLATPEGRQELAAAMAGPLRKKLEIDAVLYKRMSPKQALDRLVAAVNKHLSPEVAAVIFNEVTE